MAPDSAGLLRNALLSTLASLSRVEEAAQSLGRTEAAEVQAEVEEVRGPIQQLIKKYGSTKEE